MLLKFFNSNRLSVIVLISLLPVAYWIPSLFLGQTAQVPGTSGILLGRLLLTFNSNFRVISSLLALTLVLLNGYLLIHLNTVHIFIPARTQLPLLFYSVIVIGLNQLHQLTPSLVSSTLLILLFYRIFSAYKSESISLHFLDAGILLSAASLFFFPTLFFLPFLMAAMPILRPFNWREWAFIVIGAVIPYFFLFSIYYLLDLPITEYLQEIAESLNKTVESLRISQIVSLLYVLLILLITSFFIISNMGMMKIYARKFFSVFFLYFVFSGVIFLVIPGAGFGMVYFISVPLAFLFSHFFVKCKKNWINNLLFITFFLLLLWERIN
jgi:hypothetical protein